MAIKRPVEEHVNHERWLVSYADFITLLFAFFVVMYSISQVNESKYRVLSDVLTETFNKPESAMNVIQIGDVARSNPPSLIELNSDGLLDQHQQQQEQQQQKESENKALEDLGKEIEEVFHSQIQNELISVRGNEDWLEVEVKSSLLFDSGDATLTSSAVELLGEVAHVLRDQKNPVRIEGYTDNVPINSSKFPSNWELSTSRAAAVIQLFAEEGVSPARMAAVGYGEHQPLVANNTEENRAKNRRVVLMISKTGELRPKIADDSSLTAEQPIADLINGESVDGEGDNKVPDPDTIQGIKKVELDSGGLLFTSETLSEE